MGNRGFTDDPASNNNRPYRTLANVNYHPEIIGINRNESGQLHVLGENRGGTGSEYVTARTKLSPGIELNPPSSNSSANTSMSNSG